MAATHKHKINRRQAAGKAALMSPALLVVAIGFMVPLIMLFSISFFKGVQGSGLIDRSVFSLDNFARMFEPYYLKVLWRTFRIAIYATVLSLVMGYPVAMAMAKGSPKVKNLLLALILTPLLTNVVARTLGLMIIFGNHGPVNSILEWLGFARVKFIPSELGIVLGLAQVFMPYMILSVKSVLENVNMNLEEAARDLGCSRVSAFFQVTFPLSMPGVVAGSLFVFLLSFSSFVTPQLLGGSTVMTMTMLIYQQAMSLLDWPFAAAAAFILLTFSVILITVYNRMTSRIEKMNDRSGVYRDINYNAPRYRITRAVSNAWYGVWAAVARALGAGKKRARAKEYERLSIRAGRTAGSVGRGLLIALVVLVVVFIVLPLPVVIISAFSGDKMFVQFPPSSYSLQWFKNIFIKKEYIRSFLISLRVALISTGISLIIGTMAALALTRFKFRSVEHVKTYFLSPITLPAVIVGISMLRFSVAMDMVGSMRVLYLVHIMITSAYVIRMVLSSLVGFDMSIEEAARDLGAGPVYTFRKVTFPIIKPGIVVAGLFSFITSMDETTVSRFIVRGANQTLPVRIFAQLEYGIDLTITAISCLLILFAMLVLFVIDRTIGLNKFKM